MYKSMREQQIADELYVATTKKVQRECGSNIEVKRMQINKNNGIQLDGVVFRGESIASPTIYLDSYVEDIVKEKITVDEASDMIRDLYIEHRNTEIKIPPLTANNGELRCNVVNKNLNKSLLETVPHRDIQGTDLTLVMRFRVECDEDTVGSFLVKEEYLAMYGLTEQEAFEKAIANTVKDTYSVRTMSEVLTDMGMPKDLMEENLMQANMYVITNTSGVYGATGPFINKELRAEIADKIGGEYFLIPSSIHETLAVAGDMDPIQLQEMIREVNDTQVADGEILSEHPFYVNNNLQLSMAGEDITDQASKLTDKATESVGIHL